MAKSSLRALIPNLSVDSSSTGTTYYIQQRTSLFARISLICGTIGLATRILADSIKGHPERIVPGVYFCVVSANLSFLALWLLTRGKPLKLSIVRGVEVFCVAFGLISAGIGFRLATPALFAAATDFGRTHASLLGGGDPGLIRTLLEFTSLFVGLLVSTQILGLRAALVPSTLRHSLLIAALTGFPLTISAGLGWPSMFPSDVPFHLPDRRFLAVFGSNWWLFTGAVCAVIARVVHRLQSQVQVAKRLGQYELGRKLGEGGMGVVYQARHAMMKRPVAVKLLPAECAGHEAISRFEREVHLTSQLSHPNTVVIHDYGRTNEGVFYYVMEFVDGATLEHIVRSTGPMPSRRVAHILNMVAGSLGEAHDHGLVHRDIKPSNILIGPRGGEPDIAKVLDFGLVRSMKVSSELSNAKLMMGTPLFMSPESIRSPDKIDHRSDLYSLGAIAYYLLSGRYLFEAESAIEVCAKHMHAEPRRLDGHVANLDPGLEALVLRCLAKEPADRPASARDLREELSKCECFGAWTNAEAMAWWRAHQSLLESPQDYSDPARICIEAKS